MDYSALQEKCRASDSRQKESNLNQAIEMLERKKDIEKTEIILTSYSKNKEEINKNIKRKKRLKIIS